MAAPMMAMDYARISLDFYDCNIEDSWFLLVYSEMPTILHVIEEIVKRHKIGFNIKLHLKEKWLPPWEKSIIIKDEDSITVKVYKCQDVQKKAVCDDDTDGIKKRKREHRELSIENSSDATHTETKNPDSHSKKKKKKQQKEKSPVSKDTSIQSIHSHNKTDSPAADTSKQVSDKCSKSLDQVLRNEQTESTTHTSIVSSVVKHNSDEENNIDATNQTAENVAEETLPKKRKRIRKHRKRKNAGQDTSISSCDNSQTQAKESQARYKGRPIGKEELFFGSIPDKLVSPKYYRHGYRNLNVYQPEPNKHRVFKSDSESEHEVQEETEQYNFLSSTRIIEDREQYRPHDPMDRSPVNTSTSRINDFGKDGENNFDSPIICNTRETQPVAHSVKTDTEHTDHFNIATHLDGSVSTGQTELSRELKDDSNKERDDTMMDIDSTVSEPDTYVNKMGYPVTGNHVENSGRPGPSVLSRETLPNGVSVFVRQRRNNRTAVREMSKEEQLNTSCSNVSTIFKVPASSSPSPRRQNCRQEQNKQSQNNSCNQPPTYNTSAEFSSLSPRASPPQHRHVDGHQMSPKQTEITSSQTLADQEQQQSVTTNGKSMLGAQCKDYTQFTQLAGPPVLGMVIAYKLLEISLSCTPEVSAYKEGEVLGIDKNGMVTLKNRLPKKDVQYNKFHVEVEDEDTILTNTGEQPDQVSLHVSSLLETRVIQRP